MRTTVLVADTLVLVPAAWAVSNAVARHTHDVRNAPALVLASILLQPGLILVDHGHFQYNGVSLGLALGALAFIVNDRILWGSICYVLSLNYKQMSLYYVPVFFFGLWGKIMQGGWSLDNSLKLARLGVMVIVAFAVCWLPFIFYGSNQIFQGGKQNVFFFVPLFR